MNYKIEAGLADGRILYNKGDYTGADKAWQTAYRSISYILDQRIYESGSDAYKAIHFTITLLALNLSQVSLRLAKWHDALSFAETALSYEAHNAKALYRAALALIELERFDIASRYISRGLLHNTDDFEKLKKTNEDLAMRKKTRDKKLWKGLFIDSCRGQVERTGFMHVCCRRRAC